MDTGLRLQVESYGPVAYLITVGEEGRPHAVSVVVAWDGDDLTAGAGTRTAANVGQGSEVTLLWAPRPGGDYSLIVDGDAAIVDGASGPRVVVQPRAAVRHRLAGAGAPAGPAGDDAPGCIAVPVLEE